MELKEAPNSNDTPTHAVSLPSDLTASRLIARRGLLDLVESQDRMLQTQPPTQALGGFYEQAFRMTAYPLAVKEAMVHAGLVN